MSMKQRVPETTVGLDLGDRKSALCRLDREGEVVDRKLLPTTRICFSATSRRYRRLEW